MKPDAPCPFCGESSVVYDDETDDLMRHGWLQCDCCGCRGPTATTMANQPGVARTSEDAELAALAAELWNRRTTPEALR